MVDDWQGRGVATALLSVLVQRRPPGVERIVTVVKADNRASIAMLRRLGEVEVADSEAGVARVVVERGRGGPHFRELRSAPPLTLRPRDGVRLFVPPLRSVAPKEVPPVPPV